MLAVLVALGVGPLVLMLLHAAAEDLVFTGADGPFAGDQFQYFAWIREYSQSLLADNDLDLEPSDRVFLHPLFLLSGLGVRAGLSVELAYQLWKPVAIAVLFVGARAYVARFVEEGWRRGLALAVALFFASPAVLVFGDDVLGATGEMFGASPLWGYLPTAIAVGLMPLFLLAVERDAFARAALCGLLASWLHPWQGQVLLVTLAIAVAVTRGRGARLGPLAVVGAATLAPLLYYFLLSRADPSWELAAEANEAIGDPALWTVVVAVLPLAALAALGVRRPDNLGDAMLLAWPPASVLVFLLFSPSFPQHALEGIAIPLAVLAARAASRPPVAALAAAVLVVPGTIYLLDWFNDTVEAPGQAHYISRAEQRALDFLEDAPEPGGVITTARLGALIPSATGRRTWVGHPSWTRDYAERARLVEASLAGRGMFAVPPEARFSLFDERAGRFRP